MQWGGRKNLRGWGGGFGKKKACSISKKGGALKKKKKKKKKRGLENPVCFGHDQKERRNHKEVKHEDFQGWTI